MAKWYGIIGYVVPTETKPGVWRNEITERNYFGDILNFNHRTQTADKLQDDFVIQNRLSIVADPFALESFRYIRYVSYMGANWEVTSAEVQYPRLILSIGGIYNGTDSGRTSG